MRNGAPAVVATAWLRDAGSRAGRHALLDDRSLRAAAAWSYRTPTCAGPAAHVAK